MTAGNTMAVKMPVFMPPGREEAKPTRVGPAEQPRSPPNASRANMAVPPARREAEALLKVPGHMIPTEKPHSPQPARLSAGQGERLASR